MAKINSVAEGVSDAWDFWLSQHPISVPEIIEASVEKVFRSWLNANEEAIIERIAEKVSVMTIDLQRFFEKEKTGQTA